MLGAEEMGVNGEGDRRQSAPKLPCLPNSGRRFEHHKSAKTGDAECARGVKKQ
jgi:hypothetical protein